MHRFLFGNENAENDDLLYDCFVSLRSESVDRPILTGRWGTGKTAIILYSNKALAEKLREGGHSDRLWYLDEKTLTREALVAFKRDLTDERALKAALQDLWRAEILRVEALLLSKLSQHYGSPSGNHWRFVRKVADSAQSVVPIWQQLPTAATLVFGQSARAEAVRSLHTGLEEFFSEKLMTNIQLCLEDIAADPIQPVVAIEPIETPTSHIEQDKSLAQMLITSLLNVFRDSFEPSARQRIRVNISIPWHRYLRDDLDFPQKLFQYIGRVWWTSDGLRDFINRRIIWEFRRVNRSFSVKGSVDAWLTLFDDDVQNEYCASPVRETSFQYMLRHTHRRARDVQRLAREAVLYQVGPKDSVTADDLLAGRGGRKVNEKTIRDIVRRVCSEAAGERITEAGRRFPGFKSLVDGLKGLPVPFTRADLKKRIDRLAARGVQVELSTALASLWDAGIIGVELTPLGTDATKRLENSLGTRARRSYLVDGKTVEKRFFFEYNWEGDLSELSDLASKDEIETQLVLHPMTFEYLSPHISRSYPIGV